MTLVQIALLQKYAVMGGLVNITEYNYMCIINFNQ
jgi:hypothetical protein